MTIKINGELKNIAAGTTVNELISPEQKNQYIICRIGNQVKELSYAVREEDNGLDIELLGLDNIEAGKAYEATLRYVIAMAFHKLYPQIKIRFSYNVSRSIFCEALTPGFNMFAATAPIKAEVERIVSEDMPIKRIEVSREEAKSISELCRYLDEKLDDNKSKQFNYHFYKCGSFCDYLFSYMAPSTGCLKSYSIEPYSPGMIIQYPRYELDAEIPEFVEEPNYGRTLQKAYRWSKKTRLQTIAEIDSMVESGNALDFIGLCEAKHNSMLAELGSNIEKDIENIRLIEIAGPSSSGKTTFCNRLRIELLSRGISPVMISMDNYYLDRDRIAEIQGKPKSELDFEHINCLDIELFNKDLFALINGDTVELPFFNFNTGKREIGQAISVDRNSPIIIEGIHALNEKLTSTIPKHQKYKIYIAPQAQINIDDHSPLNITDLRLIRRIVRDMKYRNSPAERTIDMWESVRRGEFKWIYPNQEEADFVFNSCLQYELCVLRNYALPSLLKIDETAPQYFVATRLIKYLSYFQSIEDEAMIPCNSIIREFIGGSCFSL